MDGEGETAIHLYRYMMESFLNYFHPKYIFPLKLGVGSFVVEGIIKSDYETQAATYNSDVPLSISCLSRLRDLRKIQHKHLCSYIWSSRCKNERIYYVTECYTLNFESLFVTIKSEAGRKWLILKYFECLTALDYLFKRHNIVHGCIRPFDIMIVSNGSIKLGGYAIFSSTNWCLDVKFPVSAVPYSSPEMLLYYYNHHKNLRKFPPNFCPVDSRTDLWSLSLIFLGALYGKDQVNPFLNMTSISQMVKYLFTDFEKWLQTKQFNGNFDDILMKNLVLQPQNRFQLNNCIEILSNSYGLDYSEMQPFKETFHLNPLLSEDEALFSDIKSYSNYHTLNNTDISPEKAKAYDFINNSNNLDEIFHYWNLCGNTLGAVWSRHIYQLASSKELNNDLSQKHQRMPILSIPHLCYVSRDFKYSKRTSSELVWPPDQTRDDFTYEPSIFPLPVDKLIQTLARIPYDKLYPVLLETENSLTEFSNQTRNFYTGTDFLEKFEGNLFQIGLNNSTHNTQDTNFSNKTATNIESQPLANKECDVIYQISRIRIFLKLLQGLPLTEVRLRLEARKDIPPFVRPKVWAALLGVHRDFKIRERYKQRLKLAGMSFKDKFSMISTPHNPELMFLHSAENFFDEVNEHLVSPGQSVLDSKSINQISVDLPRCHAYDPLLSSDLGQMKLRRVLVSALVDGKNRNSYTQGMDSLAAVFTRLSYADEALASAMLNALIEQRLSGMFTLGGFTSGLRAYFVVIRRLLAFHMPELATHFHLLNVPITGLTTGWIYTLFAHSIPLDLSEQLWDIILPAPSCILIFIYLSVFKLLLSKTRIQLMGLEEICTLLSNFPQIDLDRLRLDALKFAQNTPASLVKDPGLPKCSLITPLNPGARKYALQTLRNWPIEFDELEFTEAYEELKFHHPLKGVHNRSNGLEEISHHRRSHSSVSQMMDPEIGSQNEGFVAHISCQDVIHHHTRADCLVLDLRSVDAFECGCLIGSINRPYPEVVALEENEDLDLLTSPHFSQPLVTMPQPRTNERFLAELKQDLAWIRTTQARRTIETCTEVQSPGLLIVLVENDSDSESTLARNVSCCLVRNGIDRVSVACGGASVLLQYPEGQKNFLPREMHPTILP